MKSRPPEYSISKLHQLLNLPALSRINLKTFGQWQDGACFCQLRVPTQKPFPGASSTTQRHETCYHKVRSNSLTSFHLEMKQQKICSKGRVLRRRFLLQTMTHLSQVFDKTCKTMPNISHSSSLWQEMACHFHFLRSSQPTLMPGLSCSVSPTIAIMIHLLPRLMLPIKPKIYLAVHVVLQWLVLEYLEFKLTLQVKQPTETEKFEHHFICFRAFPCHVPRCLTTPYSSSLERQRQHINFSSAP